MKKVLIIVQCCCCLVMVSVNAMAQKAQEQLTPKTAPAIQSTIPAPGNKAGATPEVKPVPPVMPKAPTETPATAATVSREETNKAPEKAQLKILTFDEKTVVKPNSEENKQTMSGTAQAPKLQPAPPVPVFKEAAPVLPEKPVLTAPAKKEK